MSAYLLSRAIGSIPHRELQRAETTRQVLAFRDAGVAFDALCTRHDAVSTGEEALSVDRESSLAHGAGCNALVIDKFEGRYLLSGGADSSICMFDLESARQSQSSTIHYPIGHAAKTSTTHSFGITHLSFFPFDSLAFVSSSYDHTLKVFSSETLKASASFDLHAVVYSCSISSIASHMLVACATQLPAVRLVDLRSGTSSHSLAGHNGAVLSVAWSPVDEHILASGGTDGTVRLFDIRRSAGCLGLLDMEDSIGVAGYNSRGHGARHRERGRAHNGAVNGVTFTDSGRYLTTTGHDETMRVWNMYNGANTLANFGPKIRNGNLATLLPLQAPSRLLPPGKEVVFFPNEAEILAFDLLDGTLLQQLKAPKSATSSSAAQRNAKNRTTTLDWRAHDVELYSGHSDGTIRAWKPWTEEDALAEEEKEEVVTEEDVSRKRKQEALGDLFESLTKKPLTFS